LWQIKTQKKEYILMITLSIFFEHTFWVLLETPLEDLSDDRQAFVLLNVPAACLPVGKTCLYLTADRPACR
jgi:hypothetical protein